VRLIDAPSPNFDARQAPPEMIVLHYTGMETGEAALERLRDPAARVSAHYVVEEDGRVFSLVDEARRAWHAGISAWRGVTDTNGRSIGVEIVNPGHEFGYRPFPPAQIAAVIALIGDIRSRWTIDDALILGHSDVAPRRKRDPGELFPWRTLAEAGHGLWVEPPPAPGAPLKSGDRGLGALVLRSGLARLGYDIAAAGPFDDDLSMVVTAFQRHWLQSRCDGIADGDTRARLMALLRLAGSGA
jgi:N-acetylmuramoyl-L-alanine amidase